MDFRKILHFSLGPIGAAFISLITLPILTWIFAPEDIGRISLLYVAMGLGVMLYSLGLDQAYIRDFHESEQKADLFYACLLPGLIILGLSFTIFIITDISVSQLLFDIDNQIYTLIVLCCLLLSFLSRFISLILRMNEQGIAFSLSQLIPKLAFLVIVLFYFFAFQDYVFGQLLTAHFLSITIAFIVLVIMSREELWAAKSFLPSRQKLKQLLVYGLPLVAGGLAFWGLTALDRLFLKELSSFDQLALYSVSVSFATSAMIFQSIFSTIWAPTVYKWAAEGDNLDKIEQVANYVMYAVMFIFAIVGLFSPLVSFILPSEYKSVQYLINACMAYPLLYTLSEVTVVGLGITRKSHLSMLASFIAVIANVVGNYLLIPTLGAKGAAISTALSFWLFFILRTEFSCLVWQSIARVKLYFLTFLCLFLSMTMVLFEHKFMYLINLIWAAIAVYVVIVNKDIILSQINRLKRANINN